MTTSYGPFYHLALLCGVCSCAREDPSPISSKKRLEKRKKLDEDVIAYILKVH